MRLVTTGVISLFHSASVLSARHWRNGAALIVAGLLMGMAAPAAAQTVTSFTPTSGVEGTTVRIYGTGFESAPDQNTVLFGSEQATVTAVKGDALYATVPSGVEGAVTLSVIPSGGTQAKAVSPFTVVSAPGQRGLTKTDVNLQALSSSSSDWGDFDGDGDLDLVVGGYGTPSPSTIIYENQGNGTFTALNAGLPGSRLGTVSWVDYDGDQDLDVFVSGIDQGDQTKLFENQGNGTFSEVGAGFPDTDFLSADWHDYDGDGDLDLVAMGRYDTITAIYENQGNGQFSAVGAGLEDLQGGEVEWGDFNGDGRVDIIASGETSQTSGPGVYLYKQQADRSFKKVEFQVYPNGITNGSLDWADYDNDGDLDFLISGEIYSSANRTRVYENKGRASDGDYVFEYEGAGISYVEGSSADWGDFNGDGNPDIVITGYRNFDTGAVTKVYTGDGNGGFTAEKLSLTGVGTNNSYVSQTSGSSEWADVDGDGDLDLLVTGNTTPDDAVTPSATLYENYVQFYSPEDVGLDLGQDGIQISWDIQSQEALSGYRIYRDTAPIEGTPSERESVATVSAPATSYTDEAVSPDQTYYYRLTAVDTSGAESDFSTEARVFYYPQQVTASVNRSFGGATDETGYRLVALPGQVSQPIAGAVEGNAGVQWQAYRDDGSESDFLQKHDGSEAFTFEPGNGFWLTATSEWTASSQTPTVPLEGDTSAVISLRDGWNVISNPTGKTVAYSAIEAANRAAAGGALQPLWGFDGTFSAADSMRSAAEGVAYYFLNDQGLEALRIPYPGAPARKQGTKDATNEKQPSSDLMALSAWRGEDASKASAPTSTVRLGIAASSSESRSVAAPPGRFEAVSLRIASPEETASDRRGWHMSERRTLGDESAGTTFNVRLSTRSDGPVQLQASELDALKGRSVRLLVPSAGASYNLRDQSRVTLSSSQANGIVKVAVGTSSYVDEATDQALPDKVTLTSYPNPVSKQGTVAFTLPEAARVHLAVYDVLGRKVASLARGRKEAGRHTVQFRTEEMGSGVYFGQLTVDGQQRTQKITVVR